MKFDEAMNLGLKRYMPDKPCMRGHIAQRILPNNACVECAKLLSKVRVPKREKERAYNIRITALNLLNARVKSAQAQYEKSLKLADKIEGVM
jgi:hypothetical protein